MASIMLRRAVALRRAATSLPLKELAIPKTVASRAAGAKTYACLGIASGFSLSALPFTLYAVKTPTSFCTAKCETRPEASVTDEEMDMLEKVESMYEQGQLKQVYDLLNHHPNTHADPKLLLQLAKATYKMALASPLPERKKILNDEALLYIGKAMEQRISDAKVKADVLSLYAIVLQGRGVLKSDSEKRELYELAKEHLVAALQEDSRNFYANFALADQSYDLAKTRTEASRKSLLSINAFYDRSCNNKTKDDQESLWRATSRHAYKALQTKPNDIQCINHMAQAKFAIGELQEAKRYTLMAISPGKSIRFSDERKAAKESKELMDKINEILSSKS